MRIGVLRTFLGIGIALNGAVLWDAVDRLRWLDRLVSPAEVLATVPPALPARSGEGAEATDSAVARALDQCKGRQRTATTALAVMTTVERRSNVLHAALAGISLLLMVIAVVKLPRGGIKPA